MKKEIECAVGVLNSIKDLPIGTELFYLENGSIEVCAIYMLEIRILPAKIGIGLKFLSLLKYQEKQNKLVYFADITIQIYASNEKTKLKLKDGKYFFWKGSKSYECYKDKDKLKRIIINRL